MRIEPATYIRRAAVLVAVAVFCAGASGCGSAPKSRRIAGGTLTVYESLPLHGASSREAGAVAAGVRLALADAHDGAAGRRVRLVELDSSDPKGGSTWDPAAVEANAKRAADDPTTIAYIGELDLGGSAISVPVTNDAGILQVAPLDGLTSLTQVDPAAATRTSPVRYYPSGRRTFLRLVPNDLLQASTLVTWARDQGAHKLAVVEDEHLFGRELAAQAALAAGRLKLAVTEPQEARDDPTAYPDLARKIALDHPDAVLYTGIADPQSGALLAAIRRALPGASLLATSAIASASPTPPGLPPVDVVDPVLPRRFYSAAARRVLARVGAQRGAAAGVEALYGYEAMRVVLNAIGAARRDADDRAVVVREALRPRVRTSVLGRYQVLASGDVSAGAFGSYRRSGDQLSYQGPRVAGPQAPRR